jgi:hypothetical protein
MIPGQTDSDNRQLQLNRRQRVADRLSGPVAKAMTRDACFFASGAAPPFSLIPKLIDPSNEVWSAKL